MVTKKWMKYKSFSLLSFPTIHSLNYSFFSLSFLLPDHWRIHMPPTHFAGNTRSDCFEFFSLFFLPQFNSYCDVHSTLFKLGKCVLGQVHQLVVISKRRPLLDQRTTNCVMSDLYLPSFHSIVYFNFWTLVEMNEYIREKEEVKKLFKSTWSFHETWNVFFAIKF